jgi:hypothetical protein
MLVVDNLILSVEKVSFYLWITVAKSLLFASTLANPSVEKVRITTFVFRSLVFSFRKSLSFSKHIPF